MVNFLVVGNRMESMAHLRGERGKEGCKGERVLEETGRGTGSKNRHEDSLTQYHPTSPCHRNLS